MLRKNKKKSLSSKKYEPPSKIKLRKHFNADALFTAIRREFKKIPEFQTGICCSLFKLFTMSRRFSISLTPLDSSMSNDRVAVALAILSCIAAYFFVACMKHVRNTLKKAMFPLNVEN
ncbi:MAG: hypothetical protein LWW97_11780 [Deltaproteobacteria bacterium]|nr:hypothetical protein [Deltaproteobacteria bacterium]